jgi:peptidoglycan/xylan/chitin deacetylase (PgdA/CDA1 family)
MRKLIKRSALALLKSAGLFRAFEASRWRRGGVAILCYHGISIADEHEWDPSLYMSPADFERRLEILKKRRYSVLPLDEAIGRMCTRDLPPRSVAITFDDGAYDFYRCAWPLLRAYDFPATVYLTTYYSGYNRPVFNTTASYLLWKARGRVLDGAKLGLAKPLDLRTAASRRNAWLGLLEEAESRGLTAAQKDELLEVLAAMAGVDYGNLLRKRLLHIMTPAEVSELAAVGCDFQLHTHRHRTPLDRGLFLREIRENRERIEAATGAPATHFCYPCGVYRAEFLPWLAEERVVSATTCEPALARAASHCLLLPRFVDHANLSPIEFEAGISGFTLALRR